MNTNSTNPSRIKNIALHGLFIALVYISTRFLNIPGPTSGGLFHLGNVMAFAIAIVFGKKAGAISGAFGMALFDITSSYFIWAPFTFIIRFSMGYVMGYLSYKAGSAKLKIIIFNILGIIIATIIMVGGYYITEAVMLGNFIAPIQSLWSNFMQCVIGAVIGLPLAYYLQGAFKSRNILINL